MDDPATVVPMIVAIDPGVTGAVCALDDGRIRLLEDLGAETVRVGKTNRARLVPLDVWSQLIGFAPDATVVIEEMHAQGRNGSLSNFSLGDTYGVVRTVVDCAGFDQVVTVKPERWKKDLKVGANKKSTLLMARFLWGHDRFPLEKHHNRAEAALIGHWYLTHGVTT